MLSVVASVVLAVVQVVMVVMMVGVFIVLLILLATLFIFLLPLPSVVRAQMIRGPRQFRNPAGEVDVTEQHSPGFLCLL